MQEWQLTVKKLKKFQGNCKKRGGGGTYMKEEELSVFPIGNKNEAFAQYFIGQSYLAVLTKEQIPTFNVTFEPGCSKLDYVA